MKLIQQCGSYRLVDDLPVWGGYYSIEKCEEFQDCKIWKKVFGCTSNLEEAKRKFDELTNRI